MDRAVWMTIALLLAAAAARAAEIRVTSQPDEARAALAILEVQADGRTPTAEHWDELWQSEGYRHICLHGCAHYPAGI